MLKRLLLATTLAVIAASATADESNEVTMLDTVQREDVKRMLENSGEIKGIVELNIGKIFFVETEKKYYAVSENGRFIFDGEVIDIWNKRYIRDLDSATKTNRVPLANYNVDFKNNFKAISIGNDQLPVQAVAFVDPTSEHTSSLVERALANEKETHIQLVMMPLLGGHDAIDAARALLCTDDHDLKLESLLSRNFKEITEANDSETCGVQEVQLANAMRGVFTINGLPYLIRKDGLTLRGAPEDVEKWLEQP